MGAVCLNCGTALGCSCNTRVSSNGKSCCAKCIIGYEESLHQITPAQQEFSNLSVGSEGIINVNPLPPVITSIVYNQFDK